jgi:hypothetical protein
MTRDQKPPRQPLFWAAVALSLGLWVGVRAWRPPVWWGIAVVAFVLAASGFWRGELGFLKHSPSALQDGLDISLLFPALKRRAIFRRSCAAVFLCAGCGFVVQGR